MRNKLLKSLFLFAQAILLGILTLRWWKGIAKEKMGHWKLAWKKKARLKHE